MKKINRKGGISEEIILFIPKILFLTAALFAVVILVKVFIIGVIDVRQPESSILISRLIYSKDGLSYYDNDLKRVYPGVMDLKKFSELSAVNPNSLDTASLSYGSDNPIIAAKIILKQGTGNDITVFYNKQRYEKWEPRVLSTVQGGAGSVKLVEEKKYVLVKNGDKISPAVLEFNVIG